jgi:RNA polymerase sigma-70 factor (ECF subfamily)
VAHPFQQPGWLETEARLVARVRDGDREAFSSLYRAHAPALYRLVLLPLLGEAAAAEDALAETFVAALRGWQGFQDQGGGLWPWLRRIARNKAMDAHRARARAERARARLEVEEPAAGEASPLEALAALAEVEERGAVVRAALADLHPRYRQALELRFLGELSREECARRLELKLGTFDVLVFRALRAFARAWAERAPEAGEVMRRTP